MTDAILYLRPDLVADASQLCAAKRTDCVLVVDEDEHLCGIFTAKDLAFRVSVDLVLLISRLRRLTNPHPSMSNPR